MAIIGNIRGLPVFDKKEEALVWGRRNNLTGYHTHTINRQTGYMGGSNHTEAVADIAGDPSNLSRRSGNGTGESHPCKDPLWINMLLGTPSNLQKIDYCNRCAAQPGSNGNPLLGNFPVSIVGGFWSHWQGGTNYCSCCYGVIESVSPTTTITPTTDDSDRDGY